MHMKVSSVKWRPFCAAGISNRLYCIVLHDKYYYFEINFAIILEGNISDLK